MFHGQDENHTVPPESEVLLSAVFSFPVPWHRPSRGGWEVWSPCSWSTPSGPPSWREGPPPRSAIPEVLSPTATRCCRLQVKKARQRLYHLRQLRKFRVSPAILKTFYSGAIESVLTQCISVWYGNSSNQDCKALQRVVRLAERISGSALPSLQDIYLKRCRSRAAKIIKDSNHPGNHLFCLLPSGRRFRSMMAKTERLRKSFFPQAIRLLNTNSVS